MKITLEFKEHELDSQRDGYLAALWHAAQWNHAPNADPEACRGAELIGREIIRRWLANTEPELWQRQGSHERQLPAIERAAKLNNVLTAASAVAAVDHGSTLATDRHAAVLAVEELEKALAAIQP